MEVDPERETVMRNEGAYISILGLMEGDNVTLYKADSETGKGSIANSNYYTSWAGDSLAIIFSNMTQNDTGWYYLIVDTRRGKKETTPRFYINVL